MAAKPKFAVEITQEALKSKYPTASFMADGRAVELSAENPQFETDDEALYNELRGLDGLKGLGDISESKKAAD